MLLIADFPQIKVIAWNMPKAAFIDEADALALYERNWEYVDQVALTDSERTLIERLVAQHGNGCFAHF